MRGQEETKAAEKDRGGVEEALLLSLFHFKSPSGPQEASGHPEALLSGLGAARMWLVTAVLFFPSELTSLPVDPGSRLCQSSPLLGCHTQTQCHLVLVLVSVHIIVQISVVEAVLNNILGITVER